MITIVYNARDGVAVRDGECEAVYLNLLQCHRQDRWNVFCFSTENIIARIRLGIKEGEIIPNMILLKFDDGIGHVHLLRVDRQGNYEPKLPGFCDYHIQIIDKLIDWN